MLVQRRAADPERTGDLRHGHVAALAHGQRHRPLLRSELDRPAAEPAGGLGDLSTGLGALPNELTLELRQGREDVQLELARSGGRVDRLTQRAEGDLSLLEPRDEMVTRSGVPAGRTRLG